MGPSFHRCAEFQLSGSPRALAAGINWSLQWYVALVIHFQEREGEQKETAMISLLHVSVFLAAGAL